MASSLPARAVGAPRWSSNPLAYSQENHLIVVHVARLGGDVTITALCFAARADAGIRPSTLGFSLSAITDMHRRKRLQPPNKDPLVEETWESICRHLGRARNKNAPLSAAELRRMMDALPWRLIGLRDRALLLLGFAGGFRRAELVALRCTALKFVAEGLEVFIARSKTDQEQQGHLKMIAYGSDPATCPVRAVKDWLELSGLIEGPVFRPISRYERIGPKALTAHAVATSQPS